MPTLTRELVHRYVESAQPFADSETERLAIWFAARINLHSETAEVVVIPSMGRITREVDQEWLLDVLTKRVPGRRRQKGAKAAKEVLSWKQLIVREIHTALCTRSNRYRKQADALKHNANLLIASMAGYIAGTIGVAVAIVAALVAALLRIVCEMGIAVFCGKFQD